MGLAVDRNSRQLRVFILNRVCGQVYAVQGRDVFFGVRGSRRRGVDDCQNNFTAGGIDVGANVCIRRGFRIGADRTVIRIDAEADADGAVGQNRRVHAADEAGGAVVQNALLAPAGVRGVDPVVDFVLPVKAGGVFRVGGKHAAPCYHSGALSVRAHGNRRRRGKIGAAVLGQPGRGPAASVVDRGKDLGLVHCRGNGFGLGSFSRQQRGILSTAHPGCKGAGAVSCQRRLAVAVAVVAGVAVFRRDVRAGQTDALREGAVRRFGEVQTGHIHLLSVVLVAQIEQDRAVVGEQRRGSGIGVVLQLAPGEGVAARAAKGSAGRRPAALEVMEIIPVFNGKRGIGGVGDQSGFRVKGGRAGAGAHRREIIAGGTPALLDLLPEFADRIIIRAEIRMEHVEVPEDIGIVHCKEQELRPGPDAHLAVETKLIAPVVVRAIRRLGPQTLQVVEQHQV